MESYFFVNYPEYFKKIVEIFPQDYTYLEKISNYTFSLSENKRRINNFIDGDLAEEKCNNEYLFNRDLTCITQHHTLLKFIGNNEDFYIKRLKGNYIKMFEDKNPEDEVGLLTIKELNNEQTIIPVDEIDCNIFEKADQGIMYCRLKNDLLEMLDEDAVEMIQEFEIMIDERINYYLKNKVILINDNELE